MDSVSGDGDGLFLHLNVVDLVIVVEDDLLSGGLLNRLQADVDIAVHDRQITGHGELITLDGGDVVDADVDSVSGDGDGLFLHLNIVDLVIVVEDDLLFSRCSALTVQENHGGIRDNPLVTVVVQRDGHGGAHTGMHLRIGAIRRHIGGGVELDVVVITLDAQTVARYRVAVVQQAGGDGLMALGVAVHLEVPQETLQIGIRGSDSADLDGGNAVINVHIALLGHLVPAGNLLGGDFADVDLVRVSRDFHGVGVAHLLTGYHIHKLDGDGHRFGLLGIDGVKGQITFLVVLVPAIGIVYQLGQCTVRKETIILILAIRIERPAGDLPVTVFLGRNSLLILLDNLHGANCGPGRITEADIDRPTEFLRRILVIGFVIVVRVLGPGSTDRNVFIHKGHIALQKCHIGRFLLCRIAGSMAILSLRPSQEDNPVVLGAKRSTTLQSGRIAGIVLVRIGNSTSRAIGIVEQCVRFLPIVGCAILIRIDRIEHLKDLIISCPSKVFTGFLGVQYIICASRIPL